MRSSQSPGAPAEKDPGKEHFFMSLFLKKSLLAIVDLSLMFCSSSTKSGYKSISLSLGNLFY